MEVSVLKWWGREEFFGWSSGMMQCSLSPLPSLFIQMEIAEGVLFFWEKILVITLFSMTVCGLSLWHIIKRLLIDMNKMMTL